MGQIAGNRDVAVIDRVALDGPQALEQARIAVGLGVVLAARVQGAAPEGHPQDVKGPRALFSMLRHRRSRVAQRASIPE
jgi:hypothetical protein